MLSIIGYKFMIIEKIKGKYQILIYDRDEI